jgi:hypothetical protein
VLVRSLTRDSEGNLKPPPTMPVGDLHDEKSRIRYAQQVAVYDYLAALRAAWERQQERLGNVQPRPPVTPPAAAAAGTG